MTKSKNIKNELAELQNLDSMKKFIKQNSFGLVLFYSDSSKKSLDAVKIIKDLAAEHDDVAVVCVNASKVKDIHPVYDVHSVPTVLVMKKGVVARRMEGAANRALYEALFLQVPVRRADGTEAPPMRVVVYSTPTCPHCTTVKNYLRKQRIRFRDVDVSKDTRAGEELMRRSGNAGVPQTDINGTLVVGADMAKINQLLGIR